MKQITSLHNPLVKQWCKWKKSPADFFIIDNIDVIRLAHQQKALVAVMKTSAYPFAFSQDYETYEVSPAVLAKITNYTHNPGIVGLGCYKPHEFFADSNYLLLDNISDPSNLGVLLRSAWAFGFHNVICHSETVHYLNSKVVSASKGAFFTLAIHKLDLVTWLKANYQQFVVYSSYLHHKTRPTTKFKTNHHIALLLGNEAQGLNIAWQPYCQQNLLLNHDAMLESLNVAVAGSIMMYLFQEANNGQ